MTQQSKKDTMNIYEKINAIASEIGKIEKTGRNQNQGYNFIEQAVVVSTIKPLLEQYGITIIPSVREYKLIEKEKGFKLIIDTLYKVVNTDKPDECIEIAWVGEGDDTLDKGMNKALTASQKYFYMKLFNISDKDDPDAEGKDTGKIKKAEPKKIEPTVQSTATETRSPIQAKPSTSLMVTYKNYAAKLGKTINEDELAMLTPSDLATAINILIKELKTKEAQDVNGSNDTK